MKERSPTHVQLVMLVLITQQAWKNILHQFMMDNSNILATFVDLGLLRVIVWEDILKLFMMERHPMSVQFVVKHSHWKKNLKITLLQFMMKTTIPETLVKDLWIYGPNTQIAKYIAGGLKNSYSFTDTQYFLGFWMKLFFYAYKN